jgi:hypothetical protein
VGGKAIQTNILVPRALLRRRAGSLVQMCTT